MGRDKATLEIGGVSLLRRALATLRAAGASETLVAGGPNPLASSSSSPTRVDARVVRDEGHGPFGGIVAALAESTSALVVVLAVDLPAVRARTVVDLVRRCAASQVAVVVAADGAGARQPLLSVWKRGLVLDDLIRDWNAGERSVMRWLEVRTDVSWCEVPARELTNLNEPVDLDDLGNLETP